MEPHSPAALRRARRLARLGGLLAGILVGLGYSLYLIPNSGGVLSDRYSTAVATLVIASLVGAVCGVAAGPLLSVEPYLWVERALAESDGAELVGGSVGLVVALVVAALASVLLLRLPDGLGLVLAFALTISLVSVGVRGGARRRRDIATLVDRLTPRPSPPSPGRDGEGRETPAEGAAAEAAPPVGQSAVLDTSVLIDARVLDVARAGFIPPVLVIPGFVLEELQRIADSGDPLRRAKGRRGLACVEGLQALDTPRCEVVDLDFPGVAEVDSRLIRLARGRGAILMTNDYMLNRLAQIEGLRVLNLNDLSLALKPIVSAGETMTVTIVKEGKELHQGVGYLDDGTMVVVENGRDHLDETLTATVTSVIQTPAGRMIFAQVPPSARAAAEEPPRAVRGGRGTRPRVVGR